MSFHPRNAVGFCVGAVLGMALFCPTPAGAQAPEITVGADARTAATLTIYQQNLAQIDEQRKVDLAAGRTRLAIQDVGTAIMPETATLSGPDLNVIERVFAFDALTPQRLLEAAVGKKVRVVRTNPQTGAETVLDAELLAISGGPVLKIGDRIETAEPGRVVFDKLPEGVRERPTLLAQVNAAQAGARELTLRYLTGGLNWQADYVAEVNSAGNRLDLTGFVTLTNNSGATFEHASLRLVAGDVARAPAPKSQLQHFANADSESRAAALYAAPAPQAASDRYLYTLERPVDLADRETKQVMLLHAAGVAVERRYRFEELVNAFEGTDEIGPVNAAIVLEAQNTKESGLGRPLPGGTVRVYEAADGGPLFAGEDAIRHTAEGERLKLTLGRAFDVTGEAKRTAFERISNRSYETAQEIVVRNAKDKTVDVRVVGNLPPGWKMLSESARHEAETANRIAWTLNVPAGGEATLNYRVRVSR